MNNNAKWRDIKYARNGLKIEYNGKYMQSVIYQ